MNLWLPFSTSHLRLDTQLDWLYTDDILTLWYWVGGSEESWGSYSKILLGERDHKSSLWPWWLPLPWTHWGSCRCSTWTWSSVLIVVFFPSLFLSEEPRMKVENPFPSIEMLKFFYSLNQGPEQTCIQRFHSSIRSCRRTATSVNQARVFPEQKERKETRVVATKVELTFNTKRLVRKPVLVVPKHDNWDSFLQNLTSFYLLPIRILSLHYYGFCIWYFS